MKFSAAFGALCGSHALFIGFASTDFNKFSFKIRSHDTIHTFKNYFTIVFSVFSNKRYPNRFSDFFFFSPLNINEPSIAVGSTHWKLVYLF